jgi:inner membrane protein
MNEIRLRIVTDAAPAEVERSPAQVVRSYTGQPNVDGPFLTVYNGHMDPITQAALGAAVSHAAFHRQLGMKAAAVGALAGMLPDIDSFYGALEGPFARLVSHRGITHSIFFGPVVGAAAGWAWWRYLCRRSGPGVQPAGNLQVWIGLFIVSLLSHPLLDWFTTFGTQLLAPFARTRFALDSVAIVDPVYTLILALGLFGARLLQGHSRAGWPTTTALILSTAYLMLGLRINGLAEQEAQRQLAAAGLQGYTVRAYPTMLQLPYRRVVATSVDEVRVGYISMWRPCEIEWGRAPTFTSANVEAVLATREGGIYKWFSGGRLISREYSNGDNLVVEMVDLRYGYTLDPMEGMWGIRAHFDLDGDLIEPPKRFRNRPDVNGESVSKLLADAFPKACSKAQILVGRE